MYAESWHIKTRAAGFLSILHFQMLERSLSDGEIPLGNNAVSRKSQDLVNRKWGLCFSSQSSQGFPLCHGAGQDWVLISGGRAELSVPDSSWQERGRKAPAFSSQNLAQDGDPGCSESLAGGWKVWLGHGAVPKRELSAFHSERKILWIPKFPFQGSSCSALPASLLTATGPWEDPASQCVDFCTKTFKEILRWSLTIHIGLGHGVVTTREFILYFQPAKGQHRPAVGLGRGAALL